MYVNLSQEISCPKFVFLIENIAFTGQFLIVEIS